MLGEIKVLKGYIGFALKHPDGSVTGQSGWITDPVRGHLLGIVIETPEGPEMPTVVIEGQSADLGRKITNLFSDPHYYDNGDPDLKHVNQQLNAVPAIMDRIEKYLHSHNLDNDIVEETLCDVESIIEDEINGAYQG